MRAETSGRSDIKSDTRQQRGANEQTNGVLRYWLPKSTDLAVHTQGDLDAICATLNNLHRRSLDGDTAAQRYAQLAVR